MSLQEKTYLIPTIGFFRSIFMELREIPGFTLPAVSSPTACSGIVTGWSRGGRPLHEMKRNQSCETHHQKSAKMMNS